MGKNIFTRIPERGDVCIGRRSDKKIFYITADSYDPSGIGQSVYENQGVVFHRDDEGAHIVALEQKGLPWCSRLWYYISGQQLDGEEHTATFNIRTEAGWLIGVDKTLVYKATTNEALVKQLNEFFQADEDMVKQDWWADITSDGKIRVHYNLVHFDMIDGNTSTGVELGFALPEIPIFNPFGVRKTGKQSDVSIGNLSRGMAFYKKDGGTNTPYGGVTTEQPLRPDRWIINLPTYLGTSTKNPGDFCKTMRAYYGEGEEGWKNYIKANMYHYPANRHDSGAAQSLARTLDLAKYTYTSAKVSSPTPCLPPASYCAQYATDCIQAGQWYFGDIAEIAALYDGVEFSTNPSSQSDILNKSLSLMGGSAVNNLQTVWMNVRLHKRAAWYYYSTAGFVNGYYLNGIFPILPLTLQPLKF